MKTQVNLFDAALLPVTERWSLSQLLFTLGITVLLLSLVWGGMIFQQRQINQDVHSIQRQLQQQALHQEQFTQLLQQRAPSAELTRKQALLQARLHRSQRLNELLLQQQQQQQVHYSQVLTHLAKVDVPELWLTEFTLHQNHSSFRGYSLRSAAVPGWLRRLAELPYFEGQGFQSLTMQQADESGLLLFQVQSLPGSAP